MTDEGGATPPAGGAEVNEPISTGLSSEPSPHSSIGPLDAAASAYPQSQPPQPYEPPDALAAPPSRRRNRAKSPKGAEPIADDAQDAQDARETPTRKRKRVTRTTDSARLPALRLNRMDGRERATRKPTMVYDTEHTPGYLRGVRLVVGLALLALAWGLSLVVVALADSLENGLPHQLTLSEHLGLYALSVLAILWLAVVALALIVVGALSLSLSLTRRGW